MVDMIRETVIIAGLSGVAALWIFALVGMLQVGWNSGIAPIIDAIQRKRN
tara:strand:+ start:1013 stop:1162 length:150 start_codon:yes stop_codon:yes gene_type:complete